MKVYVTPDTTPTGDCIIPCTANIVPHVLTTDPEASPTPEPVLTPAPTHNPKVGDVTLGGAYIGDIKVCSTFGATVYVNTGNQLLSSYKLTIQFSKDTFAPDICYGTNGVEPGSNGFVTTMTTDTISYTVSGFDAAGIGPGTNLKLFTVKLKAIDFGETTSYYGNSYFKTGHFQITVDELLDPSGQVIGTPGGVNYANIRFYSGDNMLGIPCYPQ